MVVSTDVYTVAATNIRTADGHVIHFSVGSLLNYEMELGRVHEDQVVDRPVVGVHNTNEPRAASIRSMTSVRERKKRHTLRYGTGIRDLGCRRPSLRCTSRNRLRSRSRSCVLR